MLNVLLVALVLLVIGPAPAEAQRTVPASREAIQLSFAPVVRQAGPAVVNITSRKAVAVERNPFRDDPFFQFFFRDFGGRAEQQIEQSLGSGVIVAGDGLIVTNHHVVAGADEIEVVLADRRSFAARLVASDERADLAFLRVEAGGEELPALELGDSDAIEVGDLVLAIGNPFGIGQTVTSGIVSATARTAPQLDREVSFIQTDAAINPGNSGGALVDMRGRLIGINTAIFSRSGGSIGIGFAVPANLVRARTRGLDGAGAGGELTRPWIGARLQPVDAEIAASLSLARPAGVLVAAVYPGAAADRAGLRTGDIVLSVDKADIADPQALGYRLSLRSIGELATLGVWRKGKTISLRLAVEPAPETPQADLTRLDRSTALDGATVANLSPAFNEQIGIDAFERGIIVLEVRSGSRAQLWRLRPRDLIESVNDRPVGTVAELRRALRGGLRRLGIRRDDGRLTVSADG